MTINKRHLSPVQVIQWGSERPDYWRIVLHNTASGNAAHTLRWWESSAERIGAAYVIDRDGTIHEAFDPAVAWAYHLGVGSKRQWWERTSLGIELVNVGPLVVKRNANGTDYFWWPEDFTTPYKLAPATIHHTASAWNGYNAWQTYTAEQYTALRELITELSRRFERDYRARITDTHLALCSADLEDPRPRAFTLLSHSNFNTVGPHTTNGLLGSRPLCKNDVGPAFNWSELA